MSQATLPAPSLRPARDWATRLFVSLWFLLLASFSIHQLSATDIGRLDALGWMRAISGLCLISFFLMISWLTMVRSDPLAQARGWQPRIAAFLGTWLMLIGMTFLPRRADLSLSMLIVSAILILIGDILAVMVLRRLGRSFSIMAEARGLVTGGPYSIVRHPLYAAEQVAIIGAAIQFASFEVLLLILLQFSCQVLRMRNEEAVLCRTFPEYRAYMARTSRLIPGVW